MKNIELKDAKNQMGEPCVEGALSDSEIDECTDAGENPGRCDPEEFVRLDSDHTLDLFRLVFEAAQKPDESSKRMQGCLAKVLTGVLCVQVAWALSTISFIICKRPDLSTNMLTFISLLVTAILGEVVAMAFFVVRFVFRTPTDMMIDLLKDIVNKRN